MADVVYVVNRGLEVTTDRIKGVGGAEPKYVAWGTGGNTTATVTDTALNTEASESRTNGTSTQETTNTTKDTYQVVGTITCAGSSKVIDEVGLFDAATTGNMYLHATFDDINVSVGDSIQFTIKVVHDQA